MTGTGTSHAEKYQWIKKKKRKKQKQGAHTSCMRKTPYAPNYVNKVENSLAWAYRTTTYRSTCRESVSVWFQSKERPRNDEEWDFRFWLREKWNKSPIFRLVFDSHSSFFAPKLHGNTCYRSLALNVLFFVTSLNCALMH